MGYESITDEAKGRMGYWFKGYEGLSKIQLVGQKNIFCNLKLDNNPIPLENNTNMTGAFRY